MKNKVSEGLVSDDVNVAVVNVPENINNYPPYFENKFDNYKYEPESKPNG